MIFDSWSAIDLGDSVIRNRKITTAVLGCVDGFNQRHGNGWNPRGVAPRGVVAVLFRLMAVRCGVNPFPSCSGAAGRRHPPVFRDGGEVVPHSAAWALLLKNPGILSRVGAGRQGRCLSHRCVLGGCCVNTSAGGMAGVVETWPTPES
jgi:hypothetical protein